MAGVGRGHKSASKAEVESEYDMFENDMVGYLEDPPTKEESQLLTRWTFPSKVGGKPAWLIPFSLPSMPTPAGEAPENGVGNHGLGCNKCGRPMRFLLQIYASKANLNDGAFHRVLHLFVCTSCQPNEAKLFRAQLPRKNDLYSGEAPDHETIQVNLENSGGADPDLDPLCCQGCGLPRDAASSSTAPCSECARRARGGEGPAMFQEREIDTIDADAPEEADELDDATTNQKCADDDIEEVFTPATAEANERKSKELVAEAESIIESARSKGASEAVLEKLQEYKKKVQESADNVIDASEQAVFDQYAKEQGDHDAVFSRFNRYAAANNGHMVRYTFDGCPLWFCGPGKLENGVPPCSNCGGKRVFEFQVQPMIMSLLQGTGPLSERLDFGTILCYVCEKSCDSPTEAPYLEEFVYVQPEPREAWLPKA